MDRFSLSNHCVLWSSDMFSSHVFTCDALYSPVTQHLGPAFIMTFTSSNTKFIIYHIILRQQIKTTTSVDNWMQVTFLLYSTLALSYFFFPNLSCFSVIWYHKSATRWHLVLPNAACHLSSSCCHSPRASYWPVVKWINHIVHAAPWWCLSLTTGQASHATHAHKRSMRSSNCSVSLSHNDNVIILSTWSKDEAWCHAAIET